MWVNGSDIKFTHRASPEMKYMFHAKYTHVPDRTPDHADAYDTAEKPRKRPYMFYFRRVPTEAQRGSSIVTLGFAGS